MADQDQKQMERATARDWWTGVLIVLAGAILSVMPLMGGPIIDSYRFTAGGGAELLWDIGAHEYDAAGEDVPAEFDVAGATYYAVAPAGYSYSGTQDTNYSTRKYNTLAAAEAGLDASPTTPQVINIIGDWTSVNDTTAVTISGITTTAANYILIRGIGAARHAGVWSSSAYRLEVSNASAISVGSNFCRIDGLLIRKSSSSSNYQACIRVNAVTASNDVRISCCVLRQAGNGSFTEPGVLINDAEAVATVWNIVSYGGGGFGVEGNAAVSVLTSTSVEIYSSTLSNGRNGVYGGMGTVTAKNCYARGGFNGYNGTITKTTCASSDTTGTTGLQNIAHDTSTFTNVTAGSEDYRLVAGSPLIDVGTDTSAEVAPLNFTTDIAGKTRGVEAGFTAQTAVFDGADYARFESDGPTGLADGKAVTVSFWTRLDGGDATTMEIFSISTNTSANRLRVFRGGANTFTINGWNASTTRILSVSTTSTFTSSASWIHIYMCIDLATASSAKIYADGVLQTISEVDYVNDDMDLVRADQRYTIGATGATTPANHLIGALAELWIDDIYLDDPAAFRSGSGPADLGADGSTPTGSAPVFYHSRNGSGDSWATDSANANVFTVTGALGSTTSP